MLEGCTHGQRKLLIEFKNKLAAVICQRNDYLYENIKTSEFRLVYQTYGQSEHKT